MCLHAEDTADQDKECVGTVASLPGFENVY